MKGLSSVVEAGEEKGCFLVAEFSCQGNLISKDYTSGKFSRSSDEFTMLDICLIYSHWF